MNKTLLRILIRAKEINKWVATKHLVDVLLQRSILLHFEDQGLLFVNHHQEKDILIKDELITFLEKAKEHLNFKAFAILRLIAYTGMRKSEALALIWNDVNFVESELTINKAIGRGKKHNFI